MRRIVIILAAAIASPLAGAGTAAMLAASNPTKRTFLVSCRGIAPFLATSPTPPSAAGVGTAMAQLSYLEYYVPAGLPAQPGHTMRISTLAVRTSAELSRISHLISRLERRGFVRRGPDPTDGPYTDAILTEAGYECLVAAAPGHVTKVRELVIDVLSPEAIVALKA